MPINKKTGEFYRSYYTPEETKRLASKKYEEYTPEKIKELVIKDVLTVVKEFTLNPASKKPSRKHLSPFIE